MLPFVLVRYARKEVFAFDKFRSYLVRSKVIVYIDHVTLRYLFAKQDAQIKAWRLGVVTVKWRVCCDGLGHGEQ